MRTLFFCLTAICIISCQENDGTTDTAKDSTTSKSSSEPSAKSAVVVVQYCYLKVIARDSFSIKIIQTDNAITGTLEFDNYEKDSSKGSIKGVTTGDTLKLWYDFESEGMHSVMEIYFKNGSDKLVRGTGSMDVKGDTSYFSNPSDIKFEEKEAWSRVDCK